ncbi:hypothetical protein AB0I35_11065 [Nocardia sp. NPDC050378]|uniref:hypothetical protein n=1 Tax=Nocardia sp. NPDC050378 TaxID=3155400 RepID=UPI0033E834B8
MTVELINPDGLPKPDVYRQLSIATGSRLVFLAGGVAALGEPDLLVEVEATAVLD